MYGNCCDAGEMLFESRERKFIIEKYHVINDFAVFIEWLLNTDIDDFVECCRYTGWNFHDMECLCLHDENVPYPIYLRIISDDCYGNAMSIEERSDNDEETRNAIRLTMNVAQLPRKEDGTFDVHDIKTILYHECRHCLEMYVIDRNTIKDVPYKALTDDRLSKCDKGILQRCCKIATLFSASEERARIDAVVHYLEPWKGRCCANEIERLLNASEYHSMVKAMFEWLDVLREEIDSGRYGYQTAILTGYVYKTCKCGVCHISFNDIDDLDNTARKRLADDVYWMLYDNMKDFVRRLHSAIYVHVIDVEGGKQSEAMRRWSNLNCTKENKRYRQ